MDNFNIIEILKLGLPGLVFLLSLLSYRLLSQAQEKQQYNPSILNAIRNFMCINVGLAVLTLVAPLLDPPILPNRVYDIEAQTGMADLAQGKAAVCQNADYANRYLLINDKKTQKLIQVFASSLIPCREPKQIVLNVRDTGNLGWSAETNKSEVEVAVAPPGYKFEI